MTFSAVTLLVASAAIIARLLFQVRRMLHLLQLEHYENARLFLWLRRRGELFGSGSTFEAGTSVALTASALLAAESSILLALGLAVLAAEALVVRNETTRKEIKPLVYTKRAKRIVVTAATAPTAIWIVAAVASIVSRSSAPATAGLLIAVLMGLNPAIIVVAANTALTPLQRRENARYVRSAQTRLAAVAPRVIGVTGSYGKTTTKVCIGSVLERHEPTLVTPASFNSYLGVVRTINEHLTPEHHSFVVEMGMYRIGDIDELCRLVHPTIGVLTAIGPAHLERLGSLDAIQQAKAELASALPPDGILIYNADDSRCVDVAQHASVASVAFGIEDSTAAVRAEAIRLIDGRTSFDLVIEGARIAVSARLLGRHNVANLLAGAPVGWHVGMTLQEIRVGLEAVEPVEHRLQPLSNSAAGVVVIDDAYNSNPAGAAAALEVLRDHPAARRILVTPGMVELGEAEELENERFGQRAAPICDRVILVGPTRTGPIRKGLLEAGFEPTSIDVVQNIGEATTLLAGLTRRGDVVLFENDLPDMYAEEVCLDRSHSVGAAA